MATSKQKHGRFSVGALTLAEMPKGTRFCDHAKAAMSVKFIRRSALNFLCEAMYLWQLIHITKTTHLHPNLKFNEASLRTGTPLFWVTTPLWHTPICVQRERGIFGKNRNRPRVPLMGQDK